ncbi:hypothetical protein F53441_1912 [Fusarium austroafricanum]|uniref:AGC-kinase C-terminal domain-containing protein n=1 Tax=Fusarium austroafricanum TaxID=2364996 RepID=A0A8H4KTG7_9HYPO|nr:hypothetical protein F53441_1912 [Fusarium austroafricanum]
MLSHLRFHRRGPSNPTSPSPDINPTSPTPTSGHPAPFSPNALSPELRPTSSNHSALPPTLPPIARVTTEDLGKSRDSRQNAVTSPVDSRPQPNSKTSSFIGGVALRKYQRDMEAQALEGADNGRLLGQHSASQPTLTSNNPPLRPSPQVLRNTKATSSFSTPTDLQHSAAVPTGRRPAGTRLVTELPSLTQTTSNSETPKPKKGLPFLKNPMSTLLMRRKNSQHVPDLRPLPLAKHGEDPIYDPRIMGTRVHDFSAPRPKKNTPNRDTVQLPVASPVPNSAPLPAQDKFLNPTATQETPLSATEVTQREPSDASESIYSQDSRALRMTPSTASTAARVPVADMDALALSDAPPVPPKDHAPISVQPRSPRASRLIDEDAYIHERSSASLRAGRSRGPSLSELSGKDIPSAIPRHMKSTSSRFSFDMIGAAKQEKLLEDRHRQRELEKKTAEPSAARDSRFDVDFDEDGFDYDAMMEDDGFEEEIPMVGDDDFGDMDDGFNNGLDSHIDDHMGNNIDNMLNNPLGGYLGSNLNNTLGGNVDDDLDDELDPDNDQENFSGFVFQRSGPTSSLTSPRSAGFLPTPRDAEGNRIGYAMSQYTPNMLGELSSNLPLDQQLNQELQVGGLGIQGLDVPRVPSLENEAAFQKNRDLSPINTGRQLNDDELYYDDGMLEFERNEFAEDLAAPPEWDDTPFDESIFDNNDTDQFGRPIAGAFAQAQAQSLQRSANQDGPNRSSDMTAPFSAGSELSKTTAHTSPSVEEKQTVEPEAPQDSPEAQSPLGPSALPPSSSPPSGDSMAAYQAALAAATYKAAASGKFQRGSSPPPDETILSEPSQSPGTPDRDKSFRQDDYESFDDYGGYNDSYEDMDSFELDDDAIIAEANASALANDCDGWYGQEFNFYSAPAGQQQGPEFEYANGGFFGPKGGLDRSTSGRMISREPNLTPITERSEYSNRNSFMSLGMPGFSGTPLQSPGLAQLALMGDRGDEMTLSALLRLRSRAWGGSQASLVSSQNGSPRSERGDLASSPWGQSIMSPTNFHTRKNSVLSTISHDSDSVSVSGSPTLTGGIPGLTLSPPPVPTLAKLDTGVKADAQVAPLNVSRPASKSYDKPISPISNPEESMPPSAMVSPLETSNRASMAEPISAPKRPGMGHRHKGSADSISYVKEEDSGATRWVMERRRTGESGQIEILEREVLEGGQI